MASDVSDVLRWQVADRAYHVCEYCLIHEADTFWGCQIDHIISRKHGGQSESANLAWACAVCNNSKGTDLGTIAGEPMELVRLFHPRKDRWAANFHLEGQRIDPLHPIGVATVKLLRMNEGSRLMEREVLAEIGRYPTIEALARMKD
jgi:hypothetical protein